MDEEQQTLLPMELEETEPTTQGPSKRSTGEASSTVGMTTEAQQTTIMYALADGQDDTGAGYMLSNTENNQSMQEKSAKSQMMPEAEQSEAGQQSTESEEILSQALLIEQHTVEQTFEQTVEQTVKQIGEQTVEQTGRETVEQTIGQDKEQTGEQAMMLTSDDQTEQALLFDEQTTQWAVDVEAQTVQPIMVYQQVTVAGESVADPTQTDRCVFFLLF
jgi:hypothetical protein